MMSALARILHPIQAARLDAATAWLALQTVAQQNRDFRTELATLRAENDLLRDELVEAEWQMKRDPAAVFGRHMAGRVGA